MCCNRHPIQIKFTSSYPMMNLLLCTCSPLYQPRFWMHFFSQTTRIHQVMINITIVRSRINQNRNNLITKLTVHLDNGCLVIRLPIIQCYIDPRNVMSNIPNYLRLLSTIDMRHTTPIWWTILLEMILATYPTLQLFPTTTFTLLLSKLRSMSLLNYIKFLVRGNIFLLTYIPRYSPLWAIYLCSYHSLSNPS